MTQKIRIGVVGLGEIAQVMHLPLLAASPDFELTAACDVSRELLEYAGRTYSIPTLVTDYRALLREVDAVAILTMEHVEIAEAAAGEGKHVFVEKPLSFSPEGCARILKAADQAETVLMIGYMRRFDPAYRLACEMLAETEVVSLARSHDFGGSFDVHPRIYGLQYPTDIEERARRELRERVDVEMREALGADHAHLTDTYFELLMSGVHDLTMLRGMFGQPEAVVSSVPLDSGGIVTTLRYPRNVIALLELHLTTDHTWWDQSLSVYGNDRTLKLEFPSPFIRNAPTILTIQREGAEPSLSRGHVSYESPFRLEWDHFAACTRDGAVPAANGKDGARDVELAVEIVQALPPERSS